MAAYIDPNSIQPGPQQAGKYARVGPNYQKYGEVPGYVYYYPTDSYYVDPNAVKQQYKEAGLIKKEPGMTDILLPITLAAAAPALGKELVTSGLPWLGEQASGLLGMGATGATGASAAAPAAASAALPTSLASTGAASGLTGASAGAGEAATGAIAPEAAGLFGTGLGALPLAGIAAGTIMGGKAAYDMLRGKKANPIGRGILGVATGGLSEVANFLGNRFGDKDRWKTEQNRLQKLQDQGYTDITLPELTGGRSKQELIDIEKQRGGNVKFAESRNEADLTPEEIANFATFYEKAGPSGTLTDRQNLARQALAAGAVREHHGTIDVDWSKVPTSAPAAAMQQVNPQTAQGLLTVGAQPQAIDAGTLKRWRESKAKGK